MGKLITKSFSPDNLYASVSVKLDHNFLTVGQRSEICKKVALPALDFIIKNIYHAKKEEIV